MESKRKPRSEMSPEEKAHDNMLRRQRKQVGNMLKLERQDAPVPEEHFGEEEIELGMELAQEMEFSEDRAPKRKARSEMTPEEKAADNALRRQRKHKRLEMNEGISTWEAEQARMQMLQRLQEAEAEAQYMAEAARSEDEMPMQMRKKARCEMTPEEKRADNAERRARARASTEQYGAHEMTTGIPSRPGVHPRALPQAAAWQVVPEWQYPAPAKLYYTAAAPRIPRRNASPAPSFFQQKVPAFRAGWQPDHFSGGMLQEQGHAKETARKPRSEMTPEEKAADNAKRRERARHGLANKI